MKNFNTSIPLSSNLIGWFAIAFSQELKFGQEKKGFIAGEHYSLSRSSEGNLIFNGKTENIAEQNDVIFVWRHPKKYPPTWHIPILNEKGWSSFRYHQLIARTHPQEVYENSIDITHFSVVHGFSDIFVEQDPHFEAHSMSVKHFIRRKNPTLFTNNFVTANFEVHLHGIGCAYNHINVPSLGLRVRMFALTTPIQQELVEIRLAVSIAMITKNPLKNILMPIIHRIIQKNIVHDFCQDILIWENKCYRSSPLLVKGDGQIIKFRHWCRQFYGEKK